MTKLSNAVLALAATLLATGAGAQVGFMLDHEQHMVPAELFGGDAVELEFSATKDFEPKAKLILVQGGTIGAGTKFSVTYSLVGAATFAEEVSNDNFKWGSWGPTVSDAEMSRCMVLDGPPRVGDAVNDADATRRAFCPLEAEMQVTREDGGKNDASVTFNLAVAGEEDIDNLVNPIRTDTNGDDAVGEGDNYAGMTRKIVFVLPDVNATGKVEVSTKIDQTTFGGGATRVAADFICYVMEGEPAMSVRKMTGCPTTVTPVAVHTVIDAGKDAEGTALPDIANVPGSGTISIEDRTTLLGAGGKAAEKITLSTIKVSGMFPAGLKDDSGNAVTEFSGALDGNLLVTVTSDNFNDGDTVTAVVTDAAKKVIGEKELDVRDGEASGSVDLTTDMVTVTYAPAGKEPLKHRALLTTKVMTEFTRANNANASATPAMSYLTLSGIKPDTARAYAIAPVTSTDRSNVRVTCESSQMCQVFLDCKDQAGMSWFWEDGTVLTGGETRVWQQSDIAMALDAESWTGRLSCEVLSTAPITVQVLTRSGDVLVNNTYVDTGG